MFFTVEKLKQRLPEIAAAAVRASLPLENILTCRAPGTPDQAAMAAPPPPHDPAWQPLHPGERWGFTPGEDPDAPPRLIDWGMPASGGSTHWLRTTLRVPEALRGQTLLLNFPWQQGGQSSLEAILYLNGQTIAGLDEFHHAVLLPEAAHSGEHELLLRVYLPFPVPFGGLSLQQRDQQIFRLGYLLWAVLDAAQTYPDSSPVRHKLLERVNTAYNALDLREGWQSERFARSAHAVLDHLRQNLTAGLEPGERPRILSTGHAHMDVAWLWPLWRTRQKIVHTVSTALHLMDQYPNYHFSMSQPQTYAYLKRDDPALYERMRQRVLEGRFEPVGMMWLEPDCNIPSGESLVRQLLLGNQFFAREFPEKYGEETSAAHVVWLPDVFGYSAALPQLLRGAGISCFMTTKISWSQFNRMPCDTFRWRGIDGSEVLTHFVTASDEPVRHPADAQFYTYVGRMTPAEAFGTWNHYRQKDVNQELLYIYGWGDGGGGPTEIMLEVANTLADLPGFPQVEQGRVEGFFQRLYERVWNDPRLPTWAGELYLEFHRGTYTSQSHTKQHNRAAELLYREAEWLNAWAASQGAPSQQEQLNDGWRIILLNQFHDILPGSSVPLVYVDSNAQYADIQRIGQQAHETSLQHILHGAVSTPASAPDLANAQYTILNSLPWQRHDYARLPLTQGQDAPTPLAANGTPLPSQLIEDYSGEPTLLIEASAPSYGYTTYTTTTEGSPSPNALSTQPSALSPQHSALSPQPSAPSTQHSALNTQHSTLSTQLLRLELDDNGELASLFDLEHNRELVAPGATLNRLVAYEDRPMNWDAWDIDIFYEEKPYPLHTVADWRVVEQGPLRSAIQITRRFGQSTLRQRICLWRNSRRIDFVTEVDWQERQTLLRALFPLNLNAARATCEIQFGAAERPTHRNTSWDWARFEVCAHRWVDLSEGGYGVALLNNGKYGHSLYHNTLGLSLLKGAIHPDPEADRGVHRFTYSLYPHAGDWRQAEIVRRAYELNVPLKVYPGPAVEAQAAPASHSFLSSPTDHIVIETIKQAEDGNGLIVRLYEAHNQRGPATIRFARPITAATEVNLLERPIAPATIAGPELRFDVRPFEVKTFRVQLG